MNSQQKQKGMTTISMVLIAFLVGIVALSAFKVYPAYYDDFAVSTALKNMEEEGSETASLSAKEIRATLSKRLQVSGVNLSKDDVEIKKEQGQVHITVNYEVRKHLYGNIDAVISFSHAIAVSK